MDPKTADDRAFIASDDRGVLQAIELAALPFAPKRCVIISDVPPGTVRGGHGHRTGQQWLVALSGEIEVRYLVDGEELTRLLRRGEPGFHLRAGMIAWQTYRSPGSQLLVLASNAYSPEDYIYPETD